MGHRRAGRILVIQFLYQQDSSPARPADDAMDAFWRIVECKKEARAFAEPVIRAIGPRIDELDALIARYSENWDPKRMARVDRNILRLALYEMCHCPDVPPVVSINEAIDIAKELSTGDSGKFVNGLLDRARKDLPRPARRAAS